MLGLIASICGALVAVFIISKLMEVTIIRKIKGFKKHSISIFVAWVMCTAIYGYVTDATTGKLSFLSPAVTYGLGAVMLIGIYVYMNRRRKRLAEQGNMNAQFELGLMYENGKDVEQDHSEAIKWYRLAAEQGDVKSQYRLGRIYYEGRGVSQDYKESAKWFLLAAEQGDPESQYILGLMYYNGLGVEQDDKKAEKWLKEAIKNGDSHAKCGLGLIYIKQKKYEQAKAIIREGCKAGEKWCKEIYDEYNLGKY